MIAKTRESPAPNASVLSKTSPFSDFAANAKYAGKTGKEQGERNVTIPAKNAAIAKRKKDIIFPYLDFSSVEKRQQACLRELDINQPHAPQIYLDVIAITRASNGHLEFNGTGTVIEWAVHMRRFCENALLAHALETHHLEPLFFDQLADEIIRYHEAAPKIISSQGHVQMAAIVDQLRCAFNAAPELFTQHDVERFYQLATTQLARAEHRLIERSRQGYVRRCHGDLHLENIVVLESRPVLFDAIEFNEDIATVDVLYDLSFLLMDLGRHSFDNVANHIFNRYLNRSEDNNNLNALRALPLFLGCRAGVRAMVIASRKETKRNSDVEDYFRAALDYLLPEQPPLIAVGGFSGTGTWI